MCGVNAGPMSPVSSQRFVITNVVANRVLIPSPRSRAGRRLGRRLAAVEYVGRRCDRRHHLVTQYRTDSRAVRIGVDIAEHKTWWRNSQAPHPVRLRLAGEDHHAMAHVERVGDRACVVTDLEPQALGAGASIGTESRSSVAAVNPTGGR